MLICIVCCGLLAMLPGILNFGLRGPSSTTRPSATKQFIRLSTTSEGRALWIQRGANEIVSVDLETEEMKRIYSRDFRSIGHWDVSRDSSTWLVCNDDREVLVYRHLEIIVAEESPGDRTLIARLSADGKTAIIIYDGTEVSCWSLPENESIKSEFVLHERTCEIALDSVHSRLYVSTDEGGIDVYDIKTGGIALTIPGNKSAIRRPLLSEDGHWLVVACGLSVSLYDALSGESVWAMRTPEPGGFHDIAISHDGRWVATSRLGVGIQVLDGLSGKVCCQFTSDAEMHRISFSPSHDTLYSVTPDGLFQTWSLSTASETKRLNLANLVPEN